MLEPLFELLAELFLFRWVWGSDDRDEAPWWALLLMVLVLAAIAGALIWWTSN